MSSFSDWARFSAGDDFWLVTCIPIVLTVAGFLGAFHFFKRKRILEDTPTSKIRSAAQGYVELSGHGDVMDGPQIIAPLTGKYCTWYSYKIEEHRGSDKNKSWSNVGEGKSDELFIIVDDTGQCVIDPDGASVTTAEKDVWYGNSARPDRGPQASGGLLFGGRYRYTETRLRPKEALYAIGLFNTIGGSGEVFDANSEVRELLKEWKKDASTMLKRFDLNKDGEIDMDEWQAVPESALEVVKARHGEMLAEAPVNMLLRTRDKRRPFLISVLRSDALIRRYRIYSSGLLVLFFGCGAFVSWAISLRLAGT